MTKFLSAAFIVFTLLVVSGCGGSSSSRAVEHHEEYVPELLLFDIVDSEGRDSADAAYKDYYILEESVFDIFWEVNSLEDYTVTLMLNDSDSPVGAIPIHSQICGAGRRCDQGGGWICDYMDNSMSCDGMNITDVYGKTRKTPYLYLILSICDYDSRYCEYDRYPVIVE
jgi:hypothetical protein